MRKMRGRSHFLSGAISLLAGRSTLPSRAVRWLATCMLNTRSRSVSCIRIRSSWSTAAVRRGRILPVRLMAAKVGLNISFAEVTPSMSSIRSHAVGRRIGQMFMGNCKRRDSTLPNSASSLPSVSRCGPKLICTRSSPVPASPETRTSINFTRHNFRPSQVSLSSRN